MCILLLVSVIYQLHFYQRQEAVTLRFSPQSGWQMITTSDQAAAIEIMPDTILTPWLIILNCRLGRQQKSIVVFKDALPKEHFRKLLVTVKINGNLRG